MTIQRRFPLAMALSIAFGGISQKLSRTQKKILASVERNNEEALLFLEKAVLIYRLITP